MKEQLEWQEQLEEIINNFKDYEEIKAFKLYISKSKHVQQLENRYTLNKLDQLVGR